MATEHLPEQVPMVELRTDQLERGVYRTSKTTTFVLGAAAVCALAWPAMHDRFTDSSSSDLLQRGDSIVATAPTSEELATDPQAQQRATRVYNDAAAVYRQSAETGTVERESYMLSAALAGLTIGAGALTRKLGAEMDKFDIAR